MSPADDVWLTLLLVALFGLPLFLRIKFPNASKRAETAVLVASTILFFSICSFFLSPHKPLTETSQRVVEVQRASSDR